MSRFLDEQEQRENRTACQTCKRVFVYLPEEKREEASTVQGGRSRVVVDCPDGHKTIVGLL